MIDKVKAFVSHYYSKQLAVYISYHILIALSYLVIISVIAFFHFLLDHKLSEIQEWVLGYGWQLVIMSKLLAVFVIFHFIEIDSPYDDIYKRITSKKRMTPDRNVLIITLFTAVFFVVAGKPITIAHHQFQIIRFLLAMIGMLVFYLTDLVVIRAVQVIYPLDKMGLRYRLIVFPIIFWIMSKITFMYADGMNGVVLVFFFATMFILNLDRRNHINVLCFVLVFSSVFVICGSDPVWGELFSTIKFHNPINTIHVFAWVVIFVGYLNIKRSKLLLKIRRKLSRLVTA